MKEIIRVKDLVRNYSKPEMEEQDSTAYFSVLRELNFTVYEGEFVGIMGKSGCGKTTLMRTLGLVDRPTDGKVYFKGYDTDELWAEEMSDIRRREIGFVYQDFFLMESLSVRENIMLPKVLDKAGTEDCLSAADRLAGKFGISHLLDKKPDELSGGEKQRAAICRALANDPDLVLGDEPTGNLDSKSGKMVVDVLENINQEMRKTIILVTHDPKVASHCKRIIFLKDGRILEDIKRQGSCDHFYRKIMARMDKL